MRRQIIIVSIVVMMTVMAFSSAAFGQTKPTWLPCPQCQTEAAKTAARAKTANLPFSPRDVSGIWGQNRPQLAVPAPPFTPLGKQMYDATMSEDAGANSKDGMLTCDPLGWPRWWTYNYGFEFVQLPDRILQFFEWDHTWRTIWMDGRDLPVDPDPRWMGYHVGRWEGDTLIIDSNGFDERTWISENRQDRRYGWPHSDQLRIQERYRRVNHNTLESTITITDPKVYTRPWVTVANNLRSPETELGEYFCAPSDSDVYNTKVLRPAAGDATR
jgi:hypothetical protein